MLKKVILAVGLLTIAVSAKNATISPSQPTHFFFVPTANVNPPNHMVIGLHELSYGLPGNLQIQASILDNIGRINFGAKFGLFDDLSIGAGLAHTFADYSERSHGIPSYAEPRLGVFLSYGLVQRSDMNLVIVPSTQIGDRLSLGIDLGLKVTPIDVWSFIGEGGFSVDTDHDFGGLYLYTAGGLRIHPPSIPFLNFDFGVDVREFQVKNDKAEVTVFVDILFSFIAK